MVRSMAWLSISDNDKTYFTRDRVSQRPSIFDYKEHRGISILMCQHQREICSHSLEMLSALWNKHSEHKADFGFGAYLVESPAFTAAESSPTYGCCGFCFSKATPLSLPKYHSLCEDVETLAVFLRTF